MNARAGIEPTNKGPADLLANRSRFLAACRRGCHLEVMA